MNSEINFAILEYLEIDQKKPILGLLIINFVCMLLRGKCVVGCKSIVLVVCNYR